MFDKILIANRGEIACRVMRTARRLGIATVAVYSEADADALHVRTADEAVAIGPAAAAESYLSIDKLVRACRDSGAQAVHPGYGFLSENPDFAEALAAAGRVFIGPSAAAIRAMGLKDAAKIAMRAAGVPVVPGYEGEAQDGERLAAEAARIGFPVLIKSRAGGGGKGMRRVDAAADFAAALAAAQREAQAAFGDPRCLIEKYIEQPRHIEVQVFGDRHGNCVHLFERDCSLQRRHQKVIEEAPAPGVDAAMRAALGEAAVRAARSIDYCGAGTVEFIVDASSGLRPDRFWFMEMNTRLQVEHPVSEAISGQDLVEWQLRVAAGEPLPRGQAALAIDGWAMEARLYAEDVPAGFLPAAGRIETLRFPAAEPGVEVHSGVEAGDLVSPHYDPMIAKIIARGADRRQALARLRRALQQTRLSGLRSNRDFLIALCGQADFRAGRPDTGLIEREGDQLTQAAPVPAAADALVAAVREGALTTPADSPEPWLRCRHYRHVGAACRQIEFERGGESQRVVISAAGEQFWVCAAAWPAPLRIAFGPPGTVLIDGERQCFAVEQGGEGLTLFLGDRTIDYRWPDPLRASEERGGGDQVLAPMPGRVIALQAAVGEAVAAGDPLLVLEAMKMEHLLRAPREGRVARVLVAPGDQIVAGALLVELGEAG